jgi:hypothetical protein
MTIETKIKQLEKLLGQTSTIQKEDSSDPDFKIWKNLVERTLIKIYEDKSFQVIEFKKLLFFYNPTFYSLGDDFTSEHRERFRRDLTTAKKTISSYISELKDELEEIKDVQPQIQTDKKINKIFISHSSSDKEFVEELIDILETIGLHNNQIFCSSFEGYGIDLGENFLERIKNELDENILVLFILSTNFYSSPICLCEMGATWIKTNEHIPILIPPFDFKDIQGVVPLTQGFKINDSLKLNLFKEKITNVFNLTLIDNSTWERKRDRILKRLEKKIK